MDTKRRLLLNPASGLGRFLQIPQDFIDDGWMTRLKPMTVVVFLFIYRKIIGWHKTSDAISYSQIKRYTGAANDTIGEALKSLEALGWITREMSVGYTTRIHLHLRNYLTPEEVMGVTEVDESEFLATLVEDTSPENGEVESEPLQYSSTPSPVFLYPPLQYSSIQYTNEKQKEENTFIPSLGVETSECLPIQPSPPPVVQEILVRSKEVLDDVPKEVFTSGVQTGRVRKFWDGLNAKISNGSPLGTNELLAVFADLYRSNHSGSRYAVVPKHRSKMKMLLESLSPQDVLKSIKYYSEHESEYPGGSMSVDVFVGWINSIRSDMAGFKPSLESKRDVDRKGGVGGWE